MKRYPFLIIWGIVILTALGSSLTAQTFTQRTGSSNYFNAVNPGWGTSAHFVDIDGDGDKDAYVIYWQDDMRFYRNDGSRIAPVFTPVSGSANPLNGTSAGNIYPFPAFVDIDADGDKDMFIGCAGNGLLFYRNTGSPVIARFTLVTGSENPFNAYSSNNFWYPGFADIDNDGDFDLFTSDLDGVIYFYRNDGSATSPVFTNVVGANNPFNGISTKPNITLGDCDGDGDFDAVFGYPDGTLGYYRNTGTASSPVFSLISGLFDGIDFGSNAYPMLADIDSDNDCDLFVGCQDGLIYTYINQTNTPPAVRNVGPGQSYSTVASAIAAANSGDLINIFEGTFTEEFIRVNKTLEIRGQGAGTIVKAPDYGGSLFIVEAGNVKIKNLTIQGGRSVGLIPNGGGIRLADGYSLSIENCMIRECRADKSGAGIYVGSGSTLTVSNSAIYNNSIIASGPNAFSGAGVYIDGAAYFINSTICGNSTSGNNTCGSGITVSGGGYCSLINCTVYGNSAYGTSTLGGGIYSDYPDRIVMKNTILALNTAGAGNQPSDIYVVMAGAVSADHCLIKQNYSNFSGSGNLVGVDPLLTALALHDNPNGTYTPGISASSPARDAGTSTGALLYDQRGFPRLNAVDIGSYESQAAYAPTVQASSLSFSIMSESQIKLTWANGNGEKRIVIAKQGSAVDGAPADETVYTANAAFGSGNQIGTGNYVVANATGNSVTVTGLSLNAAYYFYIAEYNSSSSPVYKIPGLTGNVTLLLAAPTVTTQAVTGITVSGGTGNGNVTSLGTPNPTQHGVCWSTSEGPTISNSKTTGGPVSATGAFTSSMTGLTSNTTYYVKAYATNSAGASYGQQVQFTTLSLPVVTTQAVTAITTLTATGNGNITNLGNPGLTQYGMCWNLTGDPTISDNKTTQGIASSTGAFTSLITGLTPNTSYYARAYVTNTLGTAYGEQVQFTTLPTGDYAISFNGTNQYVTGSVVTTAVDNITMEAWVKWDGQSGNRSITYNGSTGGSGYGIYLYTGAVPSQSITILCGGKGWITSGTLLPTNNWHHIAAVRVSGTWKLYLDGIEKTLNNNIVSPNTPAGYMNIASGTAGLTGGGELFKGSVDEVRFWTVARSQTDIRASMYTELAGTESGLAAYYKLNEGGGSAIDDNSPNTFVGTLVNSPLWIKGVNIPAGSGTSGSPYQIASINHLKWIYQSNTRWNKYYIQTANIDASVTSSWSSGGWTPIGTAVTKFTGSYNGQGYFIDGLYINRPSTDYQGFFSQTSGASSGVIQNVNLINTYVNGYDNVGALAGYTTSLTQINNCFSSGNVSGHNSVGGLVGNNENSTINTSYSTCSMTGSNWSLGGLVGYNCSAGHINNSYSMGTVSGTNGAGGLVGNNSGGEVDKCYSTGTVTGAGQFIGGLVGYNDYNVKNSFWDNVTSTQITGSGGTGKTTAQMKTLSTFTGAGWSFYGISGGTIWNINAGRNNGYPYLQWQYPEDVPLPVELSSFTASAEHNKVSLKWKTQTEVNNYGFDVERSYSSGVRSLNNPISESQNTNWEVIGFVQGNGNSNSPKEYGFEDNSAAYGEYTYRLKQKDNDGKFTYSEEIKVKAINKPAAFNLTNYPDPFNPLTTVRLEIPELSKVEVSVYNILGEKAATLFEGELEAGLYQSTFNGSDLSSGIYIMALSTDKNVSLVKKIMLVK